MATLKEAGYRMPAEWEPHQATWISWPKNPLTFPTGVLEGVESAYLEIIRALQQNEKVNILVDDSSWEEKVLKKIESEGTPTKNLVFYHVKSADVWIRDYSPLFVKSGEGKVAAVKWIFNAWGEKYDDLMSDNETGEKITLLAGLPAFKPNIVLEGGSIDVNGKGLLITTGQCLLNKNRNPKLTKAQIEKYLRDYLGVDEIIWLKEGLEGDDTDGHVDDFARFVNEETVVCTAEENRNDRNHASMQQNIEILKKAGLEVVKLPMPSRLEIPERRLPVSYANFYIANKVVILPVFKDKNDGVAKKILEDHFPEREVVPVFATDLVYGYGGIHCATMQQPL